MSHDNLESRLINRRATFRLIGAALASPILLTPSIAESKKPLIILSEKRPELITKYNQELDSWNKNKSNYKKARANLKNIAYELKLEGKKYSHCNVVYDNPKIKFNPFLAVSVTYALEGYDVVDLKKLISKDSSIAEKETKKAYPLFKTGLYYLNMSKKSTNILIKNGKYNSDPKKGQGTIEMAHDKTRSYWDYVRKLSAVAEQVPKLSRFDRWIIRNFAMDHFDALMNKNLHYPLKPLYKTV